MLPAGGKRRRASLLIDGEVARMDETKMEEINDPSFKTVPLKKAVKLSNIDELQKKTSPPIEIKNKFQELPIENSKIKPTPIVINKLFNNHNQLVNKLKINAPNGFNIKYNTNSTSVFIHSYEDKTKMEEQLLEDNISYYTYTEKSEKTHAFVLKGLDGNPDINEIKEELLTKNITVKNVYSMKNTMRPLYLVITNKDVTLNQLEKNIKFVLYTKIFWQRFINRKLITQCHRCQRWGHATSNCHAPVKCLKCAENHLTHECVKSLNTPAKCANCGGAHPASSIQCPVYQTRLRNLKKQPVNNEQRYADAPLPATNAWNNTRRPAISDQSKKYNENFPSLPMKPTTYILPTPSPRISKSTPHISTPPIQTPIPTINTTISSNSPLSQITQITQEINTLNTHINISKFLIHLKNLNNKMNMLHTKQEKALLFLEFTQQLDTLDI